MKMILALLTMVSLQTGSAALPVGDDCVEYSETHTLIRNDVVKYLNDDHKKLPVCENGLSECQSAISSLKTDAAKLLKTVQDQRVVIAEYKAQKRVLESYIKKLEGEKCPDNGIVTSLRESWEVIDAPLALSGGYALGTGMCLGLAYAFNQPALRR